MTSTSAWQRLRRVLLGCFVVLLMASSGFVLLGGVTTDTGLVGFLIAVSLALLPLPVVLAAYLWLDRYEPEPRNLLLFAFGWGATVAALAAATLNTATIVAISRAGGGNGMDATAVLVAPWVEEAAKGAAVLLVLVFRRREFDGVVDGIVLAGLAGLGFAFTENVLYFGRAFLAGQEQSLLTGVFAAGFTFLLRGVLSPFAHPLFTTMTGIGLGVAARTARPALRVVAPLVGYLCAVALHAAWNLASLAGLRGFLTGYLLVMLPVFVLAVGVATWSRWREGVTVAARLPAYVQAGWLDPADVALVASMRQRRAAERWVRHTYGDQPARALRALLHAATELAFLRDRLERGLAVPDFASRERELLGALARGRAAVRPVR